MNKKKKGFKTFVYLSEKSFYESYPAKKGVCLFSFTKTTEFLYHFIQ